MAVYISQSMLTNFFKIGYAKDHRVWERVSEHECGAGEMRLIAVANEGDTKLEDDVLYHLNHSRLRCRGRKRKPFEIVRPSPEVLSFLRSRRLIAMGFSRVSRPYPEKDTCCQWLERGAFSGSEPCRHALEENAKLRTLVPKSARGGWVLWEAISGRISKQLILGGLASAGLDAERLNGWPLHRVTYKGASFLFPVFYEACERMGLRPPVGAIKLGIPPRSHRVPSGRKGQPLRLHRAAASSVLPGQEPLWGKA